MQCVQQCQFILKNLVSTENRDTENTEITEEKQKVITKF